MAFPRRVCLLLSCAAALPHPGFADPEADRELFLTHCAPCHGPDGRARTPAARKLGVKDLTVTKFSAEEIRRRILEGLHDAGGKQKMPAFADKFSPAEVTALVALVQSLHQPSR